MQKTLKYKICFNVTIAMVLLYVITVLTLTELYARHVAQKMKSDFIFTGEKILKSINYADGQTESSDSAAHKMHSAYLNIIKAYDDRREYDKIKNPEPYYLKYTTAILLDKDGNVISRTGTALDFSIETHGNTENIVLPLDIYCTDEQIKQINELDGLYLIDITGYFDKRNFVPQKITFKDASSPNSILLETDFNNEPTGANEIIVAKNVEANIYSKKFPQGSINRPISKTDEKYFKESERLALKSKDEKYRTSSEISHTESNWEIQTTLGGNLYPEFKYWSNSTVFINGEECVLLMGSIGFPRQVATDKLLSVYLTMFIATACVGAMIAHGFVKTVEKEMREKEHDIFSR